MDSLRSKLLGLLYSLGIRLPPKSKHSEAELRTRLSTALDDAQRIDEVLPSLFLDINTIRTSHVATIIRLEELLSHNWEAEVEVDDVEEIPSTFPSYRLSFIELRQTIASIVSLLEKGKKICIIQDAELCSAFVIRIVDILYIPTTHGRVPALIILFEHSTRSTPSHTSIKFLKKHRTDFAPDPIPEIKSSVEEQQLFLELFRLNSSRLPKSYVPVRDDLENSFELSFILPLKAVSPSTIEKLIKDAWAACVVCGEKDKASQCSQCHAIEYCSRNCQTSDWKHHRKLCKNLKGGTWKSFPLTDSLTCHNTHANLPFIVQLVLDEGSGHAESTSTHVMDRARSLDCWIPRSLLSDVFKGSGSSGTHIVYRWAKWQGFAELSICVDKVPDEVVGLNW